MESRQPQIATDPNLGAEQAKAQNSLAANLQNQAGIDTASLMARYGTQLALAGAGMSPMSTPAATPAAGGIGAFLGTRAA